MTKIEICPKCGIRPLKIKSNGSKYKICMTSTCHPAYGKKRPEHSAHMKELAKNGSDEFKATLMRKGELFNKNVNSIDFLRKKLNSHGYIIDGLTDQEIKELNSEYESKKTKSRKTRTKTLVTRYGTWTEPVRKMVQLMTEGTDLILYLNSLSDVEFDFAFSKLHGLNTISYSSTIKESGKSFFKRIRKESLKFNTQNLPYVVTKSGLESQYIDFFEQNGYPWSYEYVIVPTKDGSGHHVPDFIVDIEGVRYMIETKGNFYGEDVDRYIENKVFAAIDYCLENDIVYVLTMCSNPKPDMNFIKEAYLISRKKKC